MPVFFIYAAVYKILVEYLSQPKTVNTSLFFAVLLCFARFTSRQRGTGGYISRFFPRYRETAPVKMTPARDDVPEGLSERWGLYRTPVAAPGRPQVRLAATSAAGRGLHELHLRRYTLKRILW